MYAMCDCFCEPRVMQPECFDCRADMSAHCSCKQAWSSCQSILETFAAWWLRDLEALLEPGLCISTWEARPPQLPVMQASPASTHLHNHLMPLADCTRDR